MVNDTLQVVVTVDIFKVERGGRGEGLEVVFFGDFSVRRSRFFGGDAVSVEDVVREGFGGTFGLGLEEELVGGGTEGSGLFEGKLEESQALGIDWGASLVVCEAVYKHLGEIFKKVCLFFFF